MTLGELFVILLNMANKNSKRNKARKHKELRKSGFPTPVYKKKARPFPRPNQDEDVSIQAQARLFHGACYKGRC